MAQGTEKEGREVTTRQFDLEAQMLTVLLATAKNAAANHSMFKKECPAEELKKRSAIAGRMYASLMALVFEMFPDDPMHMERVVLDFAKRIGYNIDQHYIGQQTGMKQ